MLVTVNDLITYMDIAFSLRQRDAAEFVLEGLQAELEAYLGRPIEIQNFVEEYVIPSDYVGMPTSSFFYNTSLDTTMSPINYVQPPSTISLRNSPVTSVNSVNIRNFSSSGQYVSEAIERSATVTAVSQSGQNVTYTAAGHGFTLGQRVSIKSMKLDAYNVVAREITGTTTTTFTVSKMPLSIGDPSVSITNVEPSTPAAGFVRYTTSAAHGLVADSKVSVTGLAPTTYNGTLSVYSVPTTTTFVVASSTTTALTDVSGTALPAGTATATGSDYTVRRYGIDLYRGFANDVVTIDYNAGLDGSEIKIFKLLILRAATREMQNMHDDVVGVKDLETRNVAPLETGFTDRELMSVKNYKRVRV